MEKSAVLGLIRNFFYPEPVRIDFAAIDIQKLQQLIKRTTLDGMCYFGLLKTGDGPKGLEKWLEERQRIVRRTNAVLEDALRELRPFPLPVFLFKNPPFLVTQDDRDRGVRYAADIDLFVNEKDLDAFDDFLAKKGFLTEGKDMDMSLPENVKEIAYSINRDLGNSDAFRNEILALIKKNSPPRQNQGRKRRILSPEPNEKDISYYAPNGALFEIHHRFFLWNLPFRLVPDNLDAEEVGENLYTFKPEDSIVLEGCHFSKHIPRLTDFYSQPCLLKYLADLCDRVRRKNIDWQRVVRLSREANASSQVYFYLGLGKNYLGVPVPDGIMEKLRENGSQLQNFLLNRINGLKLLFNEPTFFSRLYATMYLRDGNVKSLTAVAHASYNKISNNE